MSAILAQLQQLIESSHASLVGLAAHRLADGEVLLVNESVPFHPASTIKLCIMMETFRQARRGTFSLEDPIPVKNEFSSIADGSP